jgi:deoxyhypusine synthase
MNFNTIKTYPIALRKNKFRMNDMISIANAISFKSDELKQLSQQIRNAKALGSPIIFMLGGAVIKEGCSHLIIDLMRNGFVTHCAMNGSVSIHDFEIAMIGQTSEDVQGGLTDGSFGMAEETGALMNLAINQGFKAGIGYGRSIAELIEEQSFLYKESSIIFQAYSMKITTTVHVAIGGDVIHQHPACNGAALGATSYEDFKLLTDAMTKIDHGVIVNIGSAVIMPEVFLKALTIARNCGFRHNNFTVGNLDFLDMYRPRTRVCEWPRSLGAQAYNIQGRHNQTIPQLHNYLCSS